MAASSISMSLAPSIRPKQIMSTYSTNSTISLPSHCNIRSSLQDSSSLDKSCYERRSLLMATGMLAVSSIPPSSALSKETSEDYTAFVDKEDGYSYVYPSDWREFDFRAHDSAFKDRYLQLQNVRVSFIPTDKNDVHDLGPMQDVVQNLVTNILAAPNQLTFIKEIQERSVDGKNYWTFEYQLTSPNFSVTHFTTIAIANGRYYTLTVSANERRWRRVRNKLKVVADSFKVFEI
ncbi:photosynthetic NDH subunit of lumenal location 1, chloroplastic-like [Chenopodium quinoa]|uniref:photosynthetic NDH subunit of lumenal location 1, chloroplastic-like n=1 Tax=Chenopodium quinoa TaxID=63459 RepID=UPI000B786E94|nr:photosynthetic NDH subunit of lumenal location 1, chloroplastic-like [Chenopodium quinoa]